MQPRPLPRTKVTEGRHLGRLAGVNSLIRPPKRWPYQEFAAYIKERMTVKDIRTRAELSRRSGIGEGQLSNWWRGKNQPSKDSLRLLAPALGVPVLALELKAGLTAPEEVDVQPDDRTWPEQINRLLDTYIHAVQEHSDLVPGLLERTTNATEWYEVQTAKRN